MDKLFRKKDLLVILPFLAVAAAMFLWFAAKNSSGAVAVVELDGVEVGRYDLNAQKTSEIITVGGSMNVQLLLEPGTISFYRSDCPDQICVRTGKLTKPGQVAVCVPGKVSVRIISPENTGFDAFTG